MSKSDEKFLKVSSLFDQKKSSEDLAQHLVTSLEVKLTLYNLKKFDQDWSLWKGSS